MEFVFTFSWSSGETFIKIRSENVGLFARFCRNNFVLDPFEIEVDDDIIEKALVLQAKVVFLSHGYSTCSRGWILAIFFDFVASL